jgi:tetratricopeptide (TPR) repeat protein
VLSFACDLAWRKTGKDRLPSVEALCGRAAQLAPGDAQPLIFLADAYLAESREAQAATAVATAQERMEKAPDTAAEQWGSLASLYQRVRSPSLAVAAARRAPPATATEVATWAGSVRRSFALPAAPGADLEPAREREYIAAVELTRTAIGLDKLETAAQLAKQVKRDFPRLAGGDELQCEVALRQSKLPAAAAACDAALARKEDLPAAHYYAGLIAARGGKRKPAVAHLKRSIALEPALRGSWTTLAEIYRRSRDRAALAALRTDYQARFKEPLP